ncbi:MAG: ester cyclase, partial [Myxococcales bacterium]|nr:ester cyclase [Myxococcales bacterium]
MQTTQLTPLSRRAPALLALLLGLGPACDHQSTATECPDDAQADERAANVEAVERFVAEFKNAANHDVVDELMSEDFVHHLPDPRLPAGREGIKVLGQAVSSAFPDVHVTVLDTIAEDDMVVERSQVEGTHQGEFNGVPATGNRVTWTETHTYRFADGRIVEYWPQVDLLGIMMQIGAFPPPA